MKACNLIVCAVIISLVGCGKWKSGFELNDDSGSDRKSSSDSSKSPLGGLYMDSSRRGRYFIVTPNDELWGWDSRNEDGFYSEELSYDDNDYFSGDLYYFSADDPWLIDGQISGLFYEGDSLVGSLQFGEDKEPFNAIYDDLYEAKATLSSVEGSYSGAGNDFLHITLDGVISGLWDNCHFDGSIRSASDANYYKVSLNPSFNCSSGWSDEAVGVAVYVKDESISLIGIDDGGARGIYFSYDPE